MDQSVFVQIFVELHDTALAAHVLSAVADDTALAAPVLSAVAPVLSAVADDTATAHAEGGPLAVYVHTTFCMYC